MADTRLTKIGPFRAIVLCAFAAFAPTKLVEAQLADEEAQKRLPQPPQSESSTAFKLTRGLWVSLAWVLGSMTVGYPRLRQQPNPDTSCTSAPDRWRYRPALGDLVCARLGHSDVGRGDPDRAGQSVDLSAVVLSWYGGDRGAPDAGVTIDSPVAKLQPFNSN